MPLESKSALIILFSSEASFFDFSTIFNKSIVISLDKSSTRPDPNTPIVFLSFVISKTLDESSSEPTEPSKVAKSMSEASPKTLFELSPPPPIRGRLWHATHAFASGPEILLKFCGDSLLGLVLVVPDVSGLPRPSNSLKETLNKNSPCSIISSKSYSLI